MKPIFSIIAATALFGLMSCDAPAPNLSQPTPETSPTLNDNLKEELNRQLISDREYFQPTHRTYLIKLESPALFETATIENGKPVLDEAAKALVLEQQKQMLDKLASLSPEIKILFSYKLTLNALAIVAPTRLEAQLSQVAGVAQVETEGYYQRPEVITSEASDSPSNLSEVNSVSFIQADKVHQLQVTNSRGETTPVTGQGIQVGILDTGIDYTHAMFNGPGTVEAYSSVDPNKESEFFPNSKIVGGIDLVGTDYNAASLNPNLRIPRPDANPMDEGGHGSHVAGSVAGIGDNTKTYSGVAPDAKLHAIKVFGANGSTGDIVVIAGLEYAADPNKDLNLDDQLDVVNLSLGGPFGKPTILYQEAVKNLSRAGTLVVASAGNSGPVPFITGAPATSDAALSVAASIDNMVHNWQFPAAKIQVADETELVDVVEATFTKPLAEVESLVGTPVYIGLADRPLSDELAAKVKGNIALIDRGAVTFFEKLNRANQAGAIAAVVVNNQDGPAISMGGGSGEPLPIPGIMIARPIGEGIKAALTANMPVLIDLKTPELIEKPELIDTLTGFSSQGPRSLDAYLKPEISAPGANIISAAFGKGSDAIRMSGTSMSAPHMAGVSALLKQYHPSLSTSALKSLAMGTSKVIADAEGQPYSVTRQGAGRVDALKAVLSKVSYSPESISLGEHTVESKKMVLKTLTLENLSNEPLQLQLSSQLTAGLKIGLPGQISIPAKGKQTLRLPIELSARLNEHFVQAEEGQILIKSGDEVISHVPVLALVKKMSRIETGMAQVFSSSAQDAAGSVVQLEVKNSGQHLGVAHFYNLISYDEPKLPTGTENSYKSTTCDLEAAGYRLVEKDDGNQYLQIGVKLYDTVTRWEHCQLSLQIDTDLDQSTDFEVGAIEVDHLAGVGASGAYSVLLDFKKMRQIRRDAERMATQPGAQNVGLNFGPAILDAQAFLAYNHSSVAQFEVQLEKLGLAVNQKIAIKLASISEDGNVFEQDDFLGSQAQQWHLLSTASKDQSFVGLGTDLTLKPAEARTILAEKGQSDAGLLVLAPANSEARGSNSGRDQQALVPASEFSYAQPSDVVGQN